MTENTNIPEAPVTPTPPASTTVMPAPETPVDMNTMTMPKGTVVEEPKSNHLALIIGILIILIAVVLGGLYLWGAMLATSTEEMNDDAALMTEEENAEPVTAEPVAPSDETASLEADLESTEIASMESDLGTIDSEIEAGGSAQ